MQQVRTRVFDLAREYDYRTDADLARAMGISQAPVSRVRHGKRGVNKAFITGAGRAFPNLTLDELFFIEGSPNGQKEQVA